MGRLIEKLQLKPIILHEQANEGRTLIEKFEEHSDVGCAVVFVTGDDRGGPKNVGPAIYQPRARQNVILELGYFMGGPETSARVCAVRGRRRVASDYEGAAYVPLDAGGAWRVGLARELKAAGYDIDLNRAM